MSNCSWAWLCALRTNRLEEMANKLACSCIQMTYAQLSLTIMGIIAYVSVWLSVGVFICWVWFGEGKGDILMLMCYILHNSAYPFQQNKRGGVIIYVRQDLHVCETTIFNLPSGIEAAQLDINSTLTIVVVYRSPAVPIPLSACPTIWVFIFILILFIYFFF